MCPPNRISSQGSGTPAGTISVKTSEWDMFCNGMRFLPDGRAFIVGGTLQYDPFFGEARTAFYDPTNTLTCGSPWPTVAGIQPPLS